MTTIQQIKDLLRDLQEPNEWLEELQSDERKGVQNAITQWKKQYEKKQRLFADYLQKKAFDDSYKTTNISLIAGIDEAGRGPLAGPVVTAAVILPEECAILVGVDDSKKISKAQRQQFAELIKEQAVAYSVHIQPAVVIDELNIYQATKQSMEEAVNQLTIKPHTVVADAMNLNVDCPAYSIIKGDEKSLAIAAASILAKTTRDDLMTELHEQFPWYGFDENAGYGTAKHLQGLETHGFTVHHRKSFEPIKTMWSDRQ
ncbi:ribonuclease HII [Sporosarcina obsidiansis]|uniref:ribonuclease HII n=1 Tax=Sporosarcina obsidiansis TaxID=2660748 RepID=UPI00129AF6AA|nr:ribonuclease HII [Sporosarcina obsidiansis]